MSSESPSSLPASAHISLKREPSLPTPPRPPLKLHRVQEKNLQEQTTLKHILPPPSLFNNRLPPPFLFLLPSLLCPLSSGPTSLCGSQPLSPRSRSLQSFKAPAAPKRTFFPLERLLTSDASPFRVHLDSFVSSSPSLPLHPGVYQLSEPHPNRVVHQIKSRKRGEGVPFFASAGDDDPLARPSETSNSLDLPFPQLYIFFWSCPSQPPTTTSPTPPETTFLPFSSHLPSFIESLPPLERVSSPFFLLPLVSSPAPSAPRSPDADP